MKQTIGQKYRKIIIKKCHVCGHLSESFAEIKKCQRCNKSFLPLNYFSKIHGSKPDEYDYLFSEGEELSDEDIIKGIYVLW